MRTVFLSLIIIFCFYGVANAAPANAVVKLVKNITKTTKKAPRKKFPNIFRPQMDHQ